MKTNLEKLKDNSDLYLTMYFVFKEGKPPVIKQVDLDNQLIKDLAKKFRDYLVKTYLKDDLKHGNVSDADERNYNYLVFDIELISPLDELAKVSENNNIEKYKYSRDKDLNLDGYIFILGNEKVELTLYKEYYPLDIIRRDSFTLLRFDLGQSDTRFVIASESDIIKVNEKIDFLLIGDTLYVLNPKVLENNFKVHNILKKMASGFINNICTDIVENPTFIHNIIGEKPAFARKVLRVNTKSPVIGLPFGDIKKFVERHPHLQKKLKFNKTGDKFNLNTNVAANLFLKLMDDDFLKSELSQKLYESISKDSIED